MPQPIVATKEHIEQIFDDAADLYDRQGPGLFRRFGRALVDWLEIPAGARVLDVATGTGAVLVPAAERAGADGQVVGIDLSNEMLGQAQRALNQAGLANVELSHMDAEQLLFPDKVFDRVTCGFALFFFPSVEAALRELYRVCKLGGRIGVTTWGQAPFDPAWKVFAEMARRYGVEVRMPQRIAAAPDETAARLRSAGFENVEEKLETIDLVYPDEESWWAFQLTMGSRAAIYRMPEDVRARFKDEYLGQLRPLFRADGLHLPAPVVFARGGRV